MDISVFSVYKKLIYLLWSQLVYIHHSKEEEQKNVKVHRRKDKEISIPDMKVEGKRNIRFGEGRMFCCAEFL